VGFLKKDGRIQDRALDECGKKHRKQKSRESAVFREWLCGLQLAFSWILNFS
jgi:hypothetical protein